MEKFEKTDEEICKIGKGKDRQIGSAGDNRRGMKSRNKRKEGKERVKRKLRKKVKIIKIINFCN